MLRAAESLALLLLGGVAFLMVAGALGLRPSGPAGIALLPLGAVLTRRHPVGAVLGIFLLTGFVGTLTAFTFVIPRAAADFLLLSLWVGVLWGFIAGRNRPIWLWPALLAPGLFLLIAAAGVISADSLSVGLDSFRLSSWAISAVFLVAVAPWTDGLRNRMAKAALIAAALVGAYCAYRWLVGPAPDEEIIGRQAFPGLPKREPLRFFGSFVSAQGLALWFAAMVPFALGLALARRDRWGLLAVGVVGVGSFLVVASDVRGGLVALIVGMLLTVLLFQAARAFPGGVRIGTTFAAAILIAAIAVGGFTLAVGESEESRDRISRILTPTEDTTFANRLDRWEEVWPVVLEEPFGHGLGEAGQLAGRGGLAPRTIQNFDSSYLKIGLEQGLLVMILFIIAMLLLLVSLARRAISTTDPARAAVGIGASGALVALLVFYFTGFYIENSANLATWLLVGLGVAAFTSPPDRRPAPP